MVSKEFEKKFKEIWEKQSSEGAAAFAAGFNLGVNHGAEIAITEMRNAFKTPKKKAKK